MESTTKLRRFLSIQKLMLFFRKERILHRHFDYDYYLFHNPDVRESGIDPLVHYVAHGWKEGRDPSPSFQTQYYLATNPDVAAAEINPFLHYIRHGRSEGRSPSGTELLETSSDQIFDIQKTISRISSEFDPLFYLEKYYDVRNAGIDPLLHFVQTGWREKRDPNPAFSTEYYLLRNADVQRSGMNPFEHFIISGRAEGRLPKPKGWDQSPVQTDLYVESDAWDNIFIRAKKPASKLVVYTALVGGYDELHIPPYVDADVDYICFTDREIETHGIWKLRSIDYFNADQTRIPRFIKLHPHVYFPAYEQSMWIDGNVILKSNPKKILENIVGEHDVVLWDHYARQCIYEEAEICIGHKRDDPFLIREQMQRYEREGYPKSAGLVETNVLIRRHNDPTVIELMNDWWKELENGSRRDQLSFNFVVRKYPDLRIGYLGNPGDSARTHPDWGLGNHNRIAKFFT